jgi:hypothetical protein
LLEAWMSFARKCGLKAIDCISTMLNLTMLFCHFRKLKMRDSADCSSHFILLIWHLVIFSYSGNWIKNSKWGRKFRSENEIIFGVRTILKTISIRVLFEVFEQWIARLHGWIVNEREYVWININELMEYLYQFAKSFIARTFGLSYIEFRDNIHDLRPNHAQPRLLWLRPFKEFVNDCKASYKFVKVIMRSYFERLVFCASLLFNNCWKTCWILNI